jgi:hypothetical protein
MVEELHLTLQRIDNCSIAIQLVIASTEHAFESIQEALSIFGIDGRCQIYQLTEIVSE